MQKIFPFTIQESVADLVLEDFVEVTYLLWVLVRLHADAKQNVSGWTGFNISVRNKLNFAKTINAPATNMSTVHEVLVRSVKIKDALQLKSIAVVLDQALYAKATEIVWKYPDMFKVLALRMGDRKSVV